MLMSHLVGVLRRRWLATMLGLVATVSVCVSTPKFVPTEYSITSTMLLLPPVDTSVPGANPYLSLGGLTGPTEVLARAMSDPAMETRLRANGATGTWEIARDYQTSAPILTVTVTDSTVTRARATSGVILDEVPRSLNELQSTIQVKANAMITSTVVNRDADPQTVRKPLYRALLVLLVLGLLLTVAVASVIDVVAERRHRARHVREKGPSGAVPAGPAPREPAPEEVADVTEEPPTPVVTTVRRRTHRPTPSPLVPATVSSEPEPEPESDTASTGDLARSGRGATPG